MKASIFDADGNFTGVVYDGPVQHISLRDGQTWKPWEPSHRQAISRPQQQWATIRAERARLLRESDWIVTKSMERGESIPTPWLTYRQALRDITEQSDPENIVWPQQP